MWTDRKILGRPLDSTGTRGNLRSCSTAGGSSPEEQKSEIGDNHRFVKAKLTLNHIGTAIGSRMYRT